MKDNIIRKMMTIGAIAKTNLPLIFIALGYIVTLIYIIAFGGIKTTIGGAFYSTLMLMLSSISPGLIALGLSFALLTYAIIPSANRPIYKVIAPLASVLFMLATLPLFITITPAFASILVFYITCSTLLGFKYPYVNIFNMLVFAGIAALILLPALMAPAAAVSYSSLSFLTSLFPLAQACFISATIIFAINCQEDHSSEDELAPKDIQFQIATGIATLLIAAGVMAIFLGPTTMLYPLLISSALLLITIKSGEQTNLLDNPVLLFFSILFVLPVFSFTITPQILGFIGALTLNTYWTIKREDRGILDTEELDTTPVISHTADPRTPSGDDLRRDMGLDADARLDSLDLVDEHHDAFFDAVSPREFGDFDADEMGHFFGEEPAADPLRPAPGFDHFDPHGDAVADSPKKGRKPRVSRYKSGGGDDYNPLHPEGDPNPDGPARTPGDEGESLIDKLRRL